LGEHIGRSDDRPQIAAQTEEIGDRKINGWGSLSRGLDGFGPRGRFGHHDGKGANQSSHRDATSDRGARQPESH
jgi:hypothetical protein